MKHVANGNTRRAFLKGTAAVLLLLTSRQSAAQTTPPVVPPSPPTTPWQEFLDNAITHLEPVNALYSAPTVDAKATTGTTAGPRHRCWPCLSRSWRRSTMWTEPAATPAIGD